MDVYPNSIVLGRGVLGEMISATDHITDGDPVCGLLGEVVPVAARHTLQIGEGRHLDPAGQEWRAMNHACEPNLRVDVARRELIAIRRISPGEELTFHYNTTEWELAAPFDCRCGAPTCIGMVRGFRHMTVEQRAEIRPYLSPYIASRYDRFD